MCKRAFFHKTDGQVCDEFRSSAGISAKKDAYNRSMKKALFAISLTVAIIFTTAVALCVRVLNAPRAVAAFDDGGMRIVVDAGHGGIDGGVTGLKTGVKESELNLEISHCLKAALEDMGFEVTLTRKTEAGLYGAPTSGFKKRDMKRRKEIIEETEPVLVISVHQNFYPSHSVRGGQVFYNEENERSGRLAEVLQNQMNELYASQGVNARTAKPGDYFMVHCTEYPSVIVECGFLSNSADEALLVTQNWKRRLAQSMAAGVMEYLSGATA